MIAAATSVERNRRVAIKRGVKEETAGARRGAVIVLLLPEERKPQVGTAEHCV